MRIKRCGAAIGLTLALMVGATASPIPQAYASTIGPVIDTPPTEGGTPIYASDPPDEYVGSEDSLPPVEEDVTPAAEDEDISTDELDAGTNQFMGTAVQAASDLKNSCSTVKLFCLRTVPIGPTDAESLGIDALVTQLQLDQLHSESNSVELSDVSAQEKMEVDKFLAQNTEGEGLAQSPPDESKDASGTEGTWTAADSQGKTFYGQTETDGVAVLDALASGTTLKPPRLVAVPDWCLNGVNKKKYNQKWLLKRFAGCRYRGFHSEAVVRIKGRNVVIGHIYHTELEYFYMKSGSNTWAYQAQWYVYKASGNTLAARISPSGSCAFPSGGCSSASQPAASEAFNRKGHRVERSMALRYSLSAGDAYSRLGNWRHSLGAPGVDLAMRDSRTPAVRCDQDLKGYATSKGCTVPGYVPTISYVGAGVPELRNHIRDAQKSGLPGAYPKGAPLSRLYNRTQMNANRDRACPSGLPGVRGKSCDEYPFASTRQGPTFAGVPSSDWRTFSWCDISPARFDSGSVGFSRCMIDHVENSTGGNQLGAFYTKNRVLDGDKFRVKV